MKMIEKVAKAIYLCNPHLNQGEIVPWDVLQGPLRVQAINAAAVAIEAMHEPIEEMITAAEHSYRKDVKNILKVMINAIT